MKKLAKDTFKACFVLPTTDYYSMKELAWRKKMTFSEYVRRLVSKELDKKPSKKALKK